MQRAIQSAASRQCSPSSWQHPHVGQAGDSGHRTACNRTRFTSFRISASLSHRDSTRICSFGLGASHRAHSVGVTGEEARMWGGVSAFIGLSVRTMRAGCLVGSLAYGSSACLDKSAPPSCTPNANEGMSQASAGIPHPLQLIVLLGRCTGRRGAPEVGSDTGRLCGTFPAWGRAGLYG